MGDEHELVEVRARGSKSSKGRTELIINAWEKCMLTRSEEMRKGYFNFKKDRVGNETKTWIPDAREKYINSVIAFDIGTTSIHDEKYTNARKEIMKNANECFNHWGWKTFKLLKTPLQNSYNQYQYTKKYDGKIIMPEIGDSGAFVEEVTPDGKIYMKDWGDMCHNYMQSLVLIYDKLFAELVMLLHRENYLVGESYSDS